MKQKIFEAFPFTAIVLTLCLVAPAAVLAGDPKQEFTKTINREFSTLAAGTTALGNKYGKINVNTWQKNSVKIDITILVNAASQKEADRAFNRIKVNFQNTSGFVKAETVITEESWQEYYLGSKSCQDFKINYEVWMPTGNQLELRNKYGDAFVGALSGKLTADISYGILKTDRISNDADLTIGYGKAIMTKANNIYGELNYSKLDLQEAGDIQLDCKYSQIELDKGRNLRITSKYDDFNLGNVEEFRLQAKYSNVHVQNAKSFFLTAQYTEIRLYSMAGQLDADLTNGSLTIDLLRRGFSNFTVNGKYANVAVNLERGLPIRYEVSGQYSNIDLPSGAVNQHTEKMGQKRLYKGYLNDESAKAPVMIARVDHGNFDMN